MANEKIQRPDAGMIQSMMDSAARIDAKLQEVCQSEEPHRRAAQQAALQLYNDRIRKAMEQMDVEHINNGKQGIRVGLLRSQGVQNVWQVSRMSYREICDIDGLGEQSAMKIRDIVRQIEENTKATIRIRIQIENPAKVDDDLIRSLYIRIHAKPLRQRCIALYQGNHHALQQEMAVAKKGLSGFSWLFKSKKEKEQIAYAVESLRRRLSGEFGDGRLLNAWMAMERASTDACWADFKANSAAYYAELENLGLNWGTAEGAGGLPAPLAAEIEAQKLDLKPPKATLRSYQTFGAKYVVHQKRALLGDEMGLGKTVQAIAAMCALAAEGKSHFMVVCPASVLINWCREIQKFSDLEVTKVHGGDNESLLYWRENGGVAVTTFESISRFSMPERFRISMVVTDEAH